MQSIKHRHKQTGASYNINHGYWLCEEAYRALNNPENPFLLCFPDFVGADEPLFSQLLLKPHKHTILHRFLEAVASEHWEQSVKHSDIPEDYEFFRNELNRLKIPIPIWMVESELEAHKIDLYAIGRNVAKVEAQAAFQILFQDREFLLLFQSYIKSTIEEMRPQLNPESFSSKGFVRRMSSKPKWLQRAIFHRDKGCCQHCKKDLTHLINLLGKANYDHLLPLAAGGSNDPTNFQLLCQECNQSKGARALTYENQNTPFWEV